MSRDGRGESAGHDRFVCSLLRGHADRHRTVAMSIDSSRHAVVRTKRGRRRGVAFLVAEPGKQIGTPPRMAWPSSHRVRSLTNNTSPHPVGARRDMPTVRYISPLPPAEPTRLSRVPRCPQRSGRALRWRSGGSMRRADCPCSRPSSRSTPPIHYCSATSWRESPGRRRPPSRRHGRDPGGGRAGRHAARQTARASRHRLLARHAS